MRREDDTVRSGLETVLLPLELLKGTIEALAFLLGNEGNKGVATAIQEALRCLGETAKVDRIQVCKCNVHSVSGELLLSYEHEWCAGGIPSEVFLDGDLSPAFPDRGRFLAGLFSRLRAGKSLTQRSACLTRAERLHFVRFHIKSMLLLPILSGEQVWGLVALQNCEHARNWSSAERRLFQMAVLGIGAALCREKADSMRRYQASHDSLTGLLNRAFFRARVEEGLQRARCEQKGCAVFFLDVDRFKLVNETLGHAAGDQLLVGIAERLRSCVGEEAVLARIGGDEFAVLLPDIARFDEVLGFPEKVSTVFSAPFVVRTGWHYASLSIGVSVSPFDGDDPDQLLGKADVALAQARAQGGGACRIFRPSLQVSPLDRLLLENNLRSALGKNEFTVYYQPLVDLASGAADGLEALARWRHPEMGLVMPGQFIPLAEDMGVITSLGERVIRSACAEIATREKDGRQAVRVAVNVSPRQFADTDMVNMVRRVLEETRLDAHMLELELTEGIVLEDLETSIEMLRCLKRMGVRLVIDDFGVGYSSLAYLKQLPVDALKIDRIFVRDVMHDPVTASIVKTIIELAHNLNMEVTAEGVETPAQVDFFRSRGCDRLQGFLFSGPQPSSMIDEMLALR